CAGFFFSCRRRHTRCYRDWSSDVCSSDLCLGMEIGPVHVLAGGPPCQGNSDLNNHTRRRDDRNELYLTMARAAEILSPEIVLVEIGRASCREQVKSEGDDDSRRNKRTGKQ